MYESCVIQLVLVKGTKKLIENYGMFPYLIVFKKVMNLYVFCRLITKKKKKTVTMILSL